MAEERENVAEDGGVPVVGATTSPPPNLDPPQNTTFWMLAATLCMEEAAGGLVAEVEPGATEGAEAERDAELAVVDVVVNIKAY